MYGEADSGVCELIFKMGDRVIRFLLTRILHLNLSEKKLEGIIQFFKFGIVGLSNTVISYVIYVITLQAFRMMEVSEKIDYLAAQGYFLDLAEALPTNLYSRVSDRIYLTRTQEARGETVEYGKFTAYGIYLDGFSRFESLGTGLEKPVIGIVANTAHRKNGVKMLEYLTK